MLIVAITLFVASYTLCTSFFKLNGFKKMKINKICCHGTAVQSHIINILLQVEQYGEIFSSRVMYCPSLRSGQYCHPRTEYFPILPAQSCNNIYVHLVREPGGSIGTNFGSKAHSDILGVRLTVIFEKVYTHRVRKGTIALY